MEDNAPGDVHPPCSLRPLLASTVGHRGAAASGFLQARKRLHGSAQEELVVGRQVHSGSWALSARFRVRFICQITGLLPSSLTPSSIQISPLPGPLPLLSPGPN